MLGQTRIGLPTSGLCGLADFLFIDAGDPIDVLRQGPGVYELPCGAIEDPGVTTLVRADEKFFCFSVDRQIEQDDFITSVPIPDVVRD